MEGDFTGIFTLTEKILQLTSRKHDNDGSDKATIYNAADSMKPAYGSRYASRLAGIFFIRLRHISDRTDDRENF